MIKNQWNLLILEWVELLRELLKLLNLKKQNQYFLKEKKIQCVKISINLNLILIFFIYAYTAEQLNCLHYERLMRIHSMLSKVAKN